MRGIAILTYNRCDYIQPIINAVVATAPPDTRIVVCDDGSTDNTPDIIKTSSQDIIYIKGPNLGVAYNKNRALFCLQDCDFIALIEDDLIPISSGWFELYEKAVILTDIHYWSSCRGPSVNQFPDFDGFLKQNFLTPIYAKIPRGDFTFISKLVLKTIGGFHPRFKGCGGAHQEHWQRAIRAGLIPHPHPLLGIHEGELKFEQIGDTEGGRFMDDPEEIKRQLDENQNILKELTNSQELFVPLNFE